jgi:DNA-binding NarL/FixJ family response regulator
MSIIVPPSWVTLALGASASRQYPPNVHARELEEGGEVAPTKVGIVPAERFPDRIKARRVDLKFLVVDDHALTREGVRLALGALGESVTVLDAASVEAALATVHRHPDIDLVLLDLGLPGAGGSALLDALRRERNTVPVVVISGTDERSQVLKALDQGALGFIPKSFPLDLMMQAVRLVLAGGTYIPQQALAPPRGGALAEAKAGPAIAELTPRQRQILSLMSRGKPNKLIADELGITEATVKSHVTDIFRVLGVTNRTQAVIVAGDAGLA